LHELKWEKKFEELENTPRNKHTHLDTKRSYNRSPNNKNQNTYRKHTETQRRSCNSNPRNNNNNNSNKVLRERERERELWEEGIDESNIYFSLGDHELMRHNTRVNEAESEHTLAKLS
jgi:hypothetical protein